MLFRHIGHAEFLIETEGGIRIVTDPYDASCGYPVKPVEAGIILVSHHHHDHDATENVLGDKQTIIDQAGIFTPGAGIRVTAVSGYHDDAQGAKRGNTLMFLIEADGLRIVHLGDLGDGLTEEQVKILKAPDVLMIPVGGYYTIDGKTAAETARQLDAGILLPMHYRTKYNADWPISGPEEFVKNFQGEEICEGAEVLRVTREDLICQPKVVLFNS